jgi:hypothetical protein
MAPNDVVDLILRTERRVAEREAGLPRAVE